MSFKVNYSFNNGETTGIATNIEDLITAIQNAKDTLTQCTLSGIVEEDLSNLFEDCGSLVSVDLSNLNTTWVWSLNCMFAFCTSLTSVNLSNLFTTQSVCDMNDMFIQCISLTSLDLSNFDTSSVTTMARMFSGCEALTSLNLSNFDTSNVTNMNGMFQNCTALTSLDLSNLDTSNVTDMEGMFCNCSSLEHIYIGDRWNIDNVTHSSFMFDFCTNLPNYNHDITNILGCFLYMEGGTITVPSTGTVNYSFNNGEIIGTANDMYHLCSAIQQNRGFLTQCTLSGGLAGSLVIENLSLFSGCPFLTSLDLSSFNTSKVTDMSGMFSDCSSLTSLDLSSFDTSNVTNMWCMFYGCSSLTSLDLSSFNTSKVTDMWYMFCNCSNLEHIYIGDEWSTDSVTESSGMFYGCTSFPNFDSSIIDKTGCPIYMRLKQILAVVHAVLKPRRIGGFGRLRHFN